MLLKTNDYLQIRPTNGSPIHTKQTFGGDMVDQQLIELQIQREQTQASTGLLRYLRTQDRLEDEKGYSSRAEVHKLLSSCEPQVSKAILRYFETSKVKTKQYHLLKSLDINLLSIIALSKCFDSLSSPRRSSVTKVAEALGKAVEAEVFSQALKAEDPKLYKRLIDKASKTHSSVAYRKKAVRTTAAKAGFKPQDWDTEARIKCGEVLLNAVLVGCSQLFETVLSEHGSKNTIRHLSLTEEGSSLLSSVKELQQWMHPQFLPMLVPPRPWVSVDTGAYLTPEVSSRVPLVRTNDKHQLRVIAKAIQDGTMNPCLEALNTIQSTAWSINPEILSLVKWAWETGVNLKKFPLLNNIQPLKVPEDWEILDERSRKAWKLRAAKVAKRNRGIDGERVTMLQDLGVAEALSCVDRFYVPHSLDFRGRVYPVPSFNGQRPDHIRALFYFTTGKPLGPSGAYWLSVHLANCGGFSGIDKDTLDARDQWAIDNEDLILRVANDPYATVAEWSLADKPFQFVTACLEYKGFLEQGEDFVSHIPIALDGSNSGLQHYAASLRSMEGTLVNLVPQDKPADLYQMVADLVKASVTEDHTNGSDIAGVALKNGITRKLVKRNAMTFSYSSGEYGFKQQLIEDFMVPLADEVTLGLIPEHPYGPDEGYGAAGYLAKKSHKAITGLVHDATEGMSFFRRCAAVLAHEGKGLRWTTPLGLPVAHYYTEWDCKKVRMYLYDREFPVSEVTDRDKVDDGDVFKEVRLLARVSPSKRVDKGKARNAVSPNVIHSLDASHLMLTVLKAREQGIENFSLIHDSFGTHAADTSEFFYIIREAFIDLYENYCPYTTIYESTLNALDDKSKVPPIPQKGNLDVRDIYSSLYAFA